MSEPSELFKEGIKIRREVLGDAYVDKALAGVSLPCYYRNVTDCGRDPIPLGNLDKNTLPKSAGRHGEGDSNISILILALTLTFADLDWNASKDLCLTLAS